jgi:hypothetical protein
MNASGFRLSQALIAAALFAVTPGALAQTAEDDAPEVRPTGTSADAPAAETQRQRGRRRNSKDEPTVTTAATAPAAPTPSVKPAAKTDDSEVICKYDQLTGTKVKRKICGTAEQWATWRHKNQDNVEEVTRKTRQGAGSIPRPDLSQRQMPPGGGISP